MKVIFSCAFLAFLTSQSLLTQQAAPLSVPGANLQKPKAPQESVADYVIKLQTDTDAGDFERALTCSLVSAVS